MVLNGLWADSEVKEAFDNLEMETYGDDDNDEVDVDSPPDDEDTFEAYEDVDDELDELYADDDEVDIESPPDDVDA